MSKCEPEQRASRIIPAIPRKFEKKISPGMSGANGDSNQGIECLQTLHFPLHIPGNLAADIQAAAPSTTQDFGIEKHGKLPPPFYPAGQRTTTPSKLVPSNGKSEHELAGSPISDPSARQMSADENVTDQTAEPSHDSQPAATSSTPFYPPNPTPPVDDDPPESILSQYSLQAHPPFISPQHQPTPPTDATPSPTHSTYQRYHGADGISFRPPQWVADQINHSPTHSSYQGYSYAPIQTRDQSLDQPYRSSGSSIPSEHVSEASHGSQGLATKTSAPDSDSTTEGQCTQIPGFLIEWPQGFGNREGPTGLSFKPEAVSNPDDRLFEDETASSICKLVPSEHPAPGEGLVHVDDTGRLFTAMPTGAPPREVWRDTVLSDLQHVSLDPPFSSLSIPTFLMQHFDSPQYADCRLRVTFSNEKYTPEELLVHRVVIAQSPTLASLLSSSETDKDGMKLVHLEVLSSFVDPIAIRSALRTCYGQSAWNFVGLEKPKQASPLGFDDWTCWMENALAFTAAGIVLQLVDVVARGTQIVSSILGWHTIQPALKFVMEGVVDSIPDDESDEGNVQPQGLGISDGLDSSSVSAQPLRDPNPSMTSLSPYTHGIAAYRVKQLCLRFISDDLAHSDDWALKVAAPALKHLDRLPLEVDSRSPTSSSRLSHIQFGSLPMKAVAGSTSINTKISSIVLSIPCTLLLELVEQIEHVVGADKITSIVAERERRRQLVLRDKSVSYNKRAALTEVWIPVGWAEAVKTIDVDGTKQTTISRTWTGFRNPLEEQSLAQT